MVDGFLEVNGNGVSYLMKFGPLKARSGMGLTSMAYFISFTFFKSGYILLKRPGCQQRGAFLKIHRPG
jgi:hypothetical protein